MNRRERRAAGKSPETVTGIIAGADPAALYEAGMMHLRAGRTLDAQVCGQQALTADPEHADSLHLMSLVTIDAEHFDLAAEWARRAVAQDPKPQYLFTLGSVLRQQKLETIPAAYLQAVDAARVQAWEQRLGSHDRLRVGLVWAGNPDHNNDHDHSVPLGILSDLFDLDANFVSLQTDPSADDRALLSRSEVIDFIAELTDLTETSAMLSCLDLVISVDTDVAHLAGALGRPVWTLLPYTVIERDDSPWYPTMRLFRQSASRSYAEVIARVRGELNEMIAKRG
jgi:tetratricopeptide (TPR) repeat protein